TGHQQDGEEQGCTESAEVIERQDVRHDVAEVVPATDDPHQQGNFKADKNPDDYDQRVHQELKSLCIGKCKEQESRGGSADYTKQQLNPHRPVGQSAVNIS